jgi:hypothetical protein
VRVSVAAAIAAITLAVLAPGASASSVLIPRAPASQTVPPPGFAVSAREALAIAGANDKVVAERRVHAPLRPTVMFVPDRYWILSFRQRGELRAQVQVDGKTGKVLYAAHGREVHWPVLTRGQHGPRVRRLHAIMIASGALFLVSLADPRRLRRIFHLDLIALVALGVSFAFAEEGSVHAATPLMYPPLLYLLGRMFWIGWRGGTPELHTTWIGSRLLAAALGVVLVARYGWAIADGYVGDIGYASAFGADSIRHGYEIYNSAPGQGDLDAYGPFMYLAYVPFTWLFPFDLSHGHTDAARIAAMVWDAGTIATLFLIGRRLRDAQLGLLLAWAYAVCPWTWMPLAVSTNDGLVALMLALTLLLAMSPAWRGLVLGLAVAAKFAPAIVGLMFARGPGEHGRRPLLVYFATAVGSFAFIVLVFLPDGGLREFWDATIGFQLHREAPSSLWGLWPAFKPLQYVVQAGALLLAAASFALPRERTMERLAACGAALLIAAQLSTVYWYYFYVVWFLPYALVALLSRSYAGSVRNSGSSSARAVAMNSS